MSLLKEIKIATIYFEVTKRRQNLGQILQLHINLATYCLLLYFQTFYWA